MRARHEGLGFLVEQVATILGNAMAQLEEQAREIQRLRDENKVLRTHGTVIPDEPD